MLGCAFLGFTLTAAAQAPPAPAASAAGPVIGDLVSTDASVRGAVTLSATGARVMSGSNITAGESRASLRLLRGGRIDVCPRSSLSISSSPTGHELVLALGTGALEAHYQLPAAADTIITPDFRVLLAGPGKFDIAVAADSLGNTCVRSLSGNGASAIVYEQMGDGVYQVQPGGQVLFHDGTVKNPETLMPPDCGCPAPEPPRAQAQANSQPTPPLESDSAASNSSSLSPTTTHVEVDAPFVFRAKESSAPPAPLVAHLQARGMPPMLLAVPVLPPAAPPPPAAAKPKPKSFFQRLKSWFGAR